MAGVSPRQRHSSGQGTPRVGAEGTEGRSGWLEGYVLRSQRVLLRGHGVDTTLWFQKGSLGALECGKRRWWPLPKVNAPELPPGFGQEAEQSFPEGDTGAGASVSLGVGPWVGIPALLPAAQATCLPVSQRVSCAVTGAVDKVRTAHQVPGRHSDGEP